MNLGGSFALLTQEEREWLVKHLSSPYAGWKYYQYIHLGILPFVSLLELSRVVNHNWIFKPNRDKAEAIKNKLGL